MHLLQALKMACKSLLTNKLRSFLTMLGIIIGVLTVSLLTTVAQGVSKAVVSSIRTQSTLAILMNNSKTLTYKEANSIIKSVQPEDKNAEDYFDYCLAIYSNVAATYESLEGVTDDIEGYLKYEKLYDFTKEELAAMDGTEKTIAEYLMMKKKASPTNASVYAVTGNFLEVYDIKINGKFPSSKNEVLVDKEFIGYFFGSDNYDAAIGKQISLGVKYYTEISIQFNNEPNPMVLEALTKILEDKSVQTENPSEGEGSSEGGSTNASVGFGITLIANDDESKYVVSDDGKTVTYKAEFYSYMTNAMLKEALESMPSMLGIAEDGVSVADVYDTSCVKNYTIVGYSVDEENSLFSGTTDFGNGEDGANMQTLMSSYFGSTKGTAYILADSETLCSIGVEEENIDDAVISYAYFRFKTEDVMSEMVSNISIAFVKARYVPMADFMIISMSSVASIISNVMNILTIMLTVISIISLIVGGIGIMNIMLVAVTERTREIGIRKAIGAKKSSILVQFLIEALMLSLIGGAIGLIISAIGSAIIGSVMGVAMAMPAWVILMSIGFCTAIGLIFGMFPAVKASNMQPIDALRRE